MLNFDIKRKYKTFLINKWYIIIIWNTTNKGYFTDCTELKNNSKTSIESIIRVLKCASESSVPGYACLTLN